MIELPQKIEHFYDVLIVLEAVEKTSSTIEKAKILQRYQTNKDLKEVFVLTYDVNLNYYVRVPEFDDSHVSKSYNDKMDQRWQEFQSLIHKLSAKQIVGNVARQTVNTFLSSCTDLERKWYIRIINRELRIGVSEELIKKLWPFVLPPIHIMLADTLKNFDELNSKKSYYVEPKYDGVRIIMMYHEGILQVFTRNGKRQPRLESYLQEKCNFTGSILLDSECFLENWNTTTSTLFNLISDYRKLKFYVFDILDYNVYMKKGATPSLQIRKQQLKEYLPTLKNNQFVQVPDYLLSNLESIKAIYESYISRGYEGVILKESDSPYVYRRSKFWLKVKQVDFATYLCIEILPGTGRLRNTLGSIVVQDKNGITFKVGSGFTDEMRNYYWAHKNEILGKCIEVGSFPSGSKTSKQSFPTFIRVRADISDC